MENLIIDATTYTPRISFDAQDALLIISGKSYPENTFEFYKPVNKWIEDYLATTEYENISVSLDLEYLNSSSLKAYFDMFDCFEEAQKKGKILNIMWLYDEEDDITEETGVDFIEDFESLDIQLMIK